MAEVREAMFIPETGELKSTVVMGTQEIASSWVIDSQDANIMPLIEELGIRIESFALVRGESGNEIRVTMGVGDRLFVSRLPIGEHESVQPVFEQTMHAIRQQFLVQMQSAFEEERQSLKSE